MQLTPIKSSTEPAYPTYRKASSTWKKVAAAVAASAALLLPACGDTDTDSVRSPGTVAEVQHPPVTPQPDARPLEPQPPVLPEPQPVRRPGDAVTPMPPTPVEPPPARLAGRARSPEPP